MADDSEVLLALLELLEVLEVAACVREGTAVEVEIAGTDVEKDAGREDDPEARTLLEPEAIGIAGMEDEPVEIAALLPDGMAAVDESAVGMEIWTEVDPKSPLELEALGMGISELRYGKRPELEVAEALAEVETAEAEKTLDKPTVMPVRELEEPELASAELEEDVVNPRIPVDPRSSEMRLASEVELAVDEAEPEPDAVVAVVVG